MSKLGKNLEDIIKGTAALANVGISAIIGYWIYSWTSKAVEKSGDNGLIFSATYTLGVCLLVASPAILYVYNKYRNYKANQKV